MEEEEILDEGDVGRDFRHNPFTQVTAHAIADHTNGLSSTDIAVFCAICFHLGNRTRKGFPSHKTIAQMSRVSPRTVKRSIKKLEEAGYIRVEERFKAGRQWSNVYHAVDDYLERSRTNEARREDVDDTPQ